MDGTESALLENNLGLEKEPNETRVKIVNLLTASPEEMDGFRDTVSHRNGKIASLVHAYWHEDLPDGHHDSFTDPQYKAQRDQYMEACINNNVPLVLFEETGTMSNLPQRFPEKTRGIVYVIPTKKRTSEPDSYTKDPWTPVANILHRAGVEQIVLGGLVLDFDFPSTDDFLNHLSTYQQRINEEVEDLKRHGQQLAESKGSDPAAFRWLQKNVRPINCVGLAAKELLKAGLDVSISPISAPFYNKIK